MTLERQMTKQKTFEKLNCYEVAQFVCDIVKDVHDFKFKGSVILTNIDFMVPEDIPDLTITKPYGSHIMETQNMQSFLRFLALPAVHAMIESFEVGHKHDDLCTNVFYWSNPTSRCYGYTEWIKYSDLEVKGVEVCCVRNILGCKTKTPDYIKDKFTESVNTMVKAMKMRKIANAETKKLHDKLTFIMNADIE